MVYAASLTPDILVLIFLLTKPRVLLDVAVRDGDEYRNWDIIGKCGYK